MYHLHNNKHSLRDCLIKLQLSDESKHYNNNRVVNKLNIITIIITNQQQTA